MTDFHAGRHAGVLLPLFSATSTRSWGIGEVVDLVPLCRWLQQAGCSFVQLLPVNEMEASHNSPYSAITAMGIDPIYISVWALEDFAEIGGEDGFGPALRLEIERLRESSRVVHGRVRAVKQRVLRKCFERFDTRERQGGSARAAAFDAFTREHAWWLDDFALFRAVRDRWNGAPWWKWPRPLMARDRAMLAAVGRDLEGEVRFHKYLQWVAEEQWHEVRRTIAPVGIFGDVPFMVGSDSADVWTRQHAFRLDATVGTPPDAFSDTGQEWGLPVYRWDVFEAEDDAWIRERARRSTDLFDGYRIDHLVGFYRTYVIPNDDGPRVFVPAEETRQLAQGERVMRAFLSSDARVIAEDLGTVPLFVRESLTRLGLPGYRVFRWERDWHEPDQPFHDPRRWPHLSVATTGTHDTETMAEWWESADAAERQAVLRIPALKHVAIDPSDARCTPRVRDLLLELMYASGSDLLVLPMQDVFGWRDRINTPATFSEANWTWRMPRPVDRLADWPEAGERASAMARWGARHDRRRGGA